MQRVQDQDRAVRSTSSVGMPQVPLRTVITRVPGLRPVRASDTSTPAETSRVLALALSATLNAPIPPTRFGVFRM